MFTLRQEVRLVTRVEVCVADKSREPGGTRRGGVGGHRPVFLFYDAVRIDALPPSSQKKYGRTRAAVDPFIALSKSGRALAGQSRDLRGIEHRSFRFPIAILHHVRVFGRVVVEIAQHADGPKALRTEE